jgi:HrpA-like RNA helicase
MISTGRLGKISHPERIHRLRPSNSLVDSLRSDFSVSDDEVNDLFRALRDHQVVIIEGMTGSGKSTYIPYRLVEPGLVNEQIWRPRGPIIVTQPRRQATENIPYHIAKLLGSGVGPGLDIGFHYHGEDRSDLSRNRIVFVTDGILLNWLIGGSLLTRFGAIIVDEAHERSVNIDAILALLRRLLPFC